MQRSAAGNQGNCKASKNQEDRHSCLSFSDQHSQIMMSGLLNHRSLQFSSPLLLLRQLSINPQC